MEPIDKVLKILTFRGRPDLAHALRESEYELNVSTTYGSRLYSRLTKVELYAPIDKHAELQKLQDADKDDIVSAFHVLYPVRDNEPEIRWVEFLVDPEAPIPHPSRQVSRLQGIDFTYITEQVKKCDEKITSADYEGAITNARNLLESICKYILSETGEQTDPKADLQALYRQASRKLNMHPDQHTQKSFKQILSGCFSVVQGIGEIRNEMSDAHGKSPKRFYRPAERHALFAVGAAKALADFMYASFIDKTK